MESAYDGNLKEKIQIHARSNNVERYSEWVKHKYIVSFSIT
jgi:hypothetical protein